MTEIEAQTLMSRLDFVPFEPYTQNNPHETQRAPIPPFFDNAELSANYLLWLGCEQYNITQRQATVVLWDYPLHL